MIVHFFKDSMTPIKRLKKVPDRSCKWRKRVKTCRFHDVLHGRATYCVSISYNNIILVTHRIKKTMMNKVDL